MTRSDNSPILVAYFITSGLNLFAVFSNNDIGEVLTKACLMPLLLFYFLKYQPDDGIKRPVIGALVLSWLGDMALLFQSHVEFAFLVGLGFFLMAHVAYLIANFKSGLSFQLKLIPVSLTAFLLIMGFLLINLLYPGLGEMQVPVMIYAAVIVTMAVTAVFRSGTSSVKSYWWVVAGAICFILSDALIAINKFYHPLIHGGVWIMSTYIIAQYLLVKGYCYKGSRVRRCDDLSSIILLSDPLSDWP